jgi:hypothetical protein
MKRSLSDQQVEEARRLYHGRIATQKELASKYSCSVVTISLWVDPSEERRYRKFHDYIRKADRKDFQRNAEYDKGILEVVRILKHEGLTSMEVHAITKLPLDFINEYYARLPASVEDVYFTAN